MRRLVRPPERSLFDRRVNGRRLFDVSGLVAQTIPLLFVGESTASKDTEPPKLEQQKPPTETSKAIRLELDPAIENPPDQTGLFERVPLAAKQALRLFVRVSQKPIKNNPGFYVRSDGIIVDDNNAPVEFHSNKSGYSTVRLRQGARPTLVHRIVAHNFIANPSPKKKVEVDHINGIKNDNQASNLRWVTPEENLGYWVKKSPQKAAYLMGVQAYPQ